MKKKIDQIYLDNIAKSIKNSGFTQNEISKALDISPSTVNSLANGTRDPQLGTLIAIADYIGTTLDRMTGYTVPVVLHGEDDPEYTSEVINRMRASLIHLHGALYEIVNFRQSETGEINEIATYVQECIEQILNGQQLIGEQNKLGRRDK